MPWQITEKDQLNNSYINKEEMLTDWFYNLQKVQLYILNKLFLKHTRTNNKSTAPCIGHKWKDSIVKEHDAQGQQPEQNIKMFNVGDFLQIIVIIH